jgi:hypothetical protein
LIGFFENGKLMKESEHNIIQNCHIKTLLGGRTSFKITTYLIGTSDILGHFKKLNPFFDNATNNFFEKLNKKKN